MVTIEFRAPILSLARRLGVEMVWLLCSGWA